VVAWAYCLVFSKAKSNNLERSGWMQRTVGAGIVGGLDMDHGRRRPALGKAEDDD